MKFCTSKSLRSAPSGLTSGGICSAQLSTVDFRSGWHFKEEIHSRKIKNQIRREGRKRRRHLTHSAHRLQQPRQREIRDAHRKPDGYATNRSASANSKSVGNREQHTDGSDQRKRDLHIPLHR